MTPIRLLFVLPSPVLGGAEEVVLELARRLDPERFALGLAAPAPLLDRMTAELAGISITGRAIEADSWLKVREVLKLARFMRAFRPDLVNPHLFRGTLTAAPLAKALRLAPVVETYHGREAWRRGWLKGSFFWDRQVGRSVDRVIAVSRAARDFLVTVKGYPTSKVRVVPNGRDLARFAPAKAGTGEAVRRELGIPAGAPLLGVVARLEPQKGHVHLLRAMPAILEREPDCRLVLVGDGALRGELEEEARELGLTGKVTFAGFRDDVPRLFAAFDLTVLPSLYEGMPLVAIEAGAAGQPMVATDVDGTGEVVLDGRTGRLVPPADSAALARAIRELLADRSGLREMGRRAREHVSTGFTLERQVEATAEIYLEEISKRHPERLEGESFEGSRSSEGVTIVRT